MWVPRGAGAFARGEVDRAHVVEEQEGVDVRERRGRERAADDEAVSLDGALGGDETGDSSCRNGHGVLLCCPDICCYHNN